MKTVISISDDLFAAAEAAAERLGMSRSRFFARAVSAYLERHGEAVTETLDEVYAKTSARIDPVLDRLQSASLPEEDWWCNAVGALTS